MSIKKENNRMDRKSLSERRAADSLPLPAPLPKRSEFGRYYPDGGFGWAVLSVACLSHFVFGLHFGFSTLTEQIKSKFNVEESLTVWLAPSGLALTHLSSPFITALCRRKSTRLFSVVGCLLATLGTLFMSFSTKISHLFISYICVLSVGTSLTTATSSIMVARYFRKRRNLAEIFLTSSIGFGCLTYSLLYRYIVWEWGWIRSLQFLTIITLSTVISGIIYRSPSLYHPRRRAILHVKNQRKTKNQRREEKINYFDLSPLRMRSFQLLAFSTALISFGSFVPFGIPETNSTVISIASTWPVGSALSGLLILRWPLPGQYLIQLSSFILGIFLILSTIFKGSANHIVLSSIYGIGIGSWNYFLRYHSYKTVGCKLSEVSWSYQVFAQSLPTLFGSPVVFFTNQHLSTKYGFFISGCSIILGCLVIFFWSFAAKHQTNQEVLREAHLKTKIFQEDSLFAMKVSDEYNARLNKENLVQNTWSREERVQEFVLQTSNNSLPLQECLSTAV